MSEQDYIMIVNGGDPAENDNNVSALKRSADG